MVPEPGLSVWSQVVSISTIWELLNSQVLPQTSCITESWVGLSKVFFHTLQVVLMLLKLRNHCAGVLGPSGMSWLSPLCPRILDPHGVPRTVEHRKALVKHHIHVNSLVRKDSKCGVKEHLRQGKHLTLKLIHKDTKSQCWLISQWLLGSELRSDRELPAKQLAPHCLEHLCPTELCSDGNVD